MRVKMRTGWKVPFLVGMVTTACVSHVPIEGSPCPCPNGIDCCIPLAQCLSPGTTCPEIYPTSSRQSCQRDSDCTKFGEFCESWTVDGIAAGSGECRRGCAEGLPCADGEICGLSPHDLQPLKDLHVAHICVSITPPAGCEGQGCYDCNFDELGKTYCDGHLIRGWFLATHPQCGLTCRSLIAKDCGMVSCVVEEGIVQCQKVAFYSDPCVSMACSLCDHDPGSFFCDGSNLSVCASLPTTHLDCGGTACKCSEICSRQTVRSCDGCSETNGGPSCSAN
jgi:hypothetical protein